MIALLTSAVAVLGLGACDQPGRGFLAEEDREDNGCDVVSSPAEGLQPVTGSTADELINQMLGTSGFGNDLTHGSFNGSDAITATADSGYYKILLQQDSSGQNVSGVDNVIVVQSDVPLSEWNWYRSDYSLVSSGEVWTAGGWVAHEYDLTSQPSHPEASPHEGHYWYRIEIGNATMPNSLLAFLSSQDQPATLRFFARDLYPRHEQPVEDTSSPTQGLQPVKGSTPDELINQMLGSSGFGLDLGHGSFNGSDAITATEDFGYYKIKLEQGFGEENISGVDNVIVVQSDAPLWEWNWYRSDYSLVSPGEVWGENGWIDHDYDITGASSHPDARPHEGYYWYRIEMEDATMPSSMLAFLSSQGQPATVRFFAQDLYPPNG